MRFSRFLCPVFLLVVPSLSSCATSSSEYIEESVGFAASRGQLLQVEKLTFQKIEYLSDGVAVEVTGDECSVTFGFDGERKRTFRLGSGDRLVVGRSVEAVLIQHGEEELPKGEGEEPQANGPRP